MNTFDILQTLSETPGPSGFEQAIADKVADLWQPYADEFLRDQVGNLIALKRGSGPEPRRKLLLAAHMDEIALMVKRIVAHNGQGFLRVTPVGGVDRRHLYGQLVIVHGRSDLSGVLGSLPARMLPPERRTKAFGFEDLVVDVGLPFSDVAANVSIGDFVSFRQPLRKLQGKLATGKALDNRASVTAVTDALKYLQTRAHPWDVVAVATCQEETRLLGAYTSAFSQYPDVALAIDVGFGKGPGANGENIFELGSGPVLDIGPNVHPGVYKALQSAAEALEMSVSVGTHQRGSGTDAFGLQVARAGIPTGLISIPLRYMHTMVETVHLADVKRSGRLMGEFATRLDDQFLQTLSASMMENDETEAK